MSEATSAALGGLDLSSVTGNAPFDYYFAVKSRQGGRDVYTIQMPVEESVRTLPVPNPAIPTPGNRKVNATHAKGFGRYVREHADWVAPALMVRAGDDIRFEKQGDLPGGLEIGILAVSRAGTALRILDGQHRVLGGSEGWKDLSAEITRLEDRIARDKSGGKPEDKQNLAKLQLQRERFMKEHFVVQIYMETRPEKFEQMFFDVADNALGINQAVKARFDSRKVVNRSLVEVTKHALLKDRVDLEQDRIKGANPNLVGAKHVADIIRAVNVGVVGRIGARREAQLDDGEIVERSNEFLDALVGGFSTPLDKLVDGSMTAEELRQTSLLGSVTMLRVLGGVFFEMTSDDIGATADQVQDFFEDLSPHMSAPVGPESVWMVTGDFDAGSYGPRARTQNLKHLVDTIVQWAVTGDIGAKPTT